MTVTRRSMIGLAALAVAPRGAAADPMAAIAGRLAALHASPADACAIARAYVSASGADTWRAAAGPLDMARVLAPAAAIDDPATLRAWLGARIRADFAEGAVVDVDGWRLSRTEVGACLLVAGAA